LTFILPNPSDTVDLGAHRTRKQITLRWVRHGAVGFLAAFLIVYLVIPKLITAHRNIHRLEHLNVPWVIVGVVTEGLCLFCYALLTKTLLPANGPSLSKVFRIDLSTAAVSHVVPAGSAGSAGLGYRLLTNEGVDGSRAGFAIATQAIGSAVVLNVILWISLVVSIPLAGIHAIYVIVALIGLIALSLVGVLAYALIRGEERATSIVRSIGRRIPRMGEDRLEGIFRRVGSSLNVFVNDKELRKQALLWATLNWLLDAAALWAFLAALGVYVDPVELLAAYGIANVLGALPITPGGFGVVEGISVSLLVSFGVNPTSATLGVLGWRLVNFWLPIPVGAGAFISLRLGRGSRIRGGRKVLSELATYTHVETEQAATAD
jgi:uncharacterized protein (TIRG00374 family)